MPALLIERITETSKVPLNLLMWITTVLSLFFHRHISAVSDYSHFIGMD